MFLSSPFNPAELHSLLKQRYPSSCILLVENIIKQLHYLNPKIILESNFNTVLIRINESIYVVNNFLYGNFVIDLPFLVCGVYLLREQRFLNGGRLDALVQGGRKFFSALSLLYRVRPCLFTPDHFDRLAEDFDAAYERSRAFIFFYDVGFLEYYLPTILELFVPIVGSGSTKGILTLNMLEKIFKYAPALITQQCIDEFLKLNFRETLYVHETLKVTDKKLLVEEGISSFLQKCSAHVAEALKETSAQASISLSMS